MSTANDSERRVDILEDTVHQMTEQIKALTSAIGLLNTHQAPQVVQSVSRDTGDARDENDAVGIMKQLKDTQ